VAAPVPEPAAPRLPREDRRRYVRLVDTRPEHPPDGALDRASSVIEGVLTRFRGMVRSVGARRGLVDADLDEVLQDVRIRLWQAGQAGKPLAELGSSFLYQVATSAALDVLRRRRAHRADAAVELDEHTELPATTASPHDAVERRELAAQIDAALATIAPDRRVAVRMHLSGYDREDISRALGWSEARTRNLVYRGLEDLRRKLAAMGVTPRGRV
jgi:RNA polymerase sigma-70 factor (ECF subfamily)